MNAASKVKTRGHSELRSESKAGLIFAMKPTIKSIRPVDDLTNRERRERRDMIYLVLKGTGLSADEIAEGLKDAARSPSQIRRRIAKAKNGVQAKQNRRLAACG